MPARNDRQKLRKSKSESIIHGRVPSKKTLKKQIRNGKYSLKRLAEKGVELDDLMTDVTPLNLDPALEKKLKNKNKASKLFASGADVKKDSDTAAMDVQSTGRGTILGAPAM
ncbi:pre-60S shuttling factor [Schizosaccharomyces japonicus yFS275]|uniref:Pre-60S shuttling factor n=1 Tax=Schizosaccharomyces japonicus (strain yFS275 / FY16936) TaxID=402676 RepID=B6JX06_SCHJY|nr:pre-60S shuttling factor [Schizosaccharomyces japonicus yFS275]EEB05907.1 pre-60S shuttling factor [Schizosaccharomyces japonicus yFS275]